MNIVEQSATILDWSNIDLYERVETAARVCRRSESKGDAEGFVRSLIKRGHLSPLEFARIRFGDGSIHNVRRLYEQQPQKFFQHWVIACCSWSVFVELDQQTKMELDQHRKEASDAGVDPTKYCAPANDWIPVLITTSRTISHQLVRYRHDICFMQESQRHVRYDKTGLEVIEPPGLERTAKYIWSATLDIIDNAYKRMMELGCKAEQARSVLPGCTATRLLAYASPEEWRHIFDQRCDKHADPQMWALMEPLQAEMQRRGLI